MTDCKPQRRWLMLPAVDNEPWQKRLRRAGLTQAELATIAGARENAVSDGLRGKGKNGVPRYLRSLIRLWEMADSKEREALLSDPDAEP